MEKNIFLDLDNLINKQRDLSFELKELFQNSNFSFEEKSFINSEVNSLKRSILKLNNSFFEKIKKVHLVEKDLSSEVSSNLVSIKKLNSFKKASPPDSFLSSSFNFDSELLSINRFKKNNVDEKIINPKVDLSKNSYSLFSNKFFSRFSRGLLEKGFFKHLNRDLSNAGFRPIAGNYLSISIFSSLIVLLVSIFFSFFYLFVNFSLSFPFVQFYDGDLFSRALQIFWIVLVFPIVSFLFIIYYPKLEAKGRSSQIDQELPFVAINLAAISGSLLEPTKIFEILILNKEYPHVEKEFIKLVNEVNIFGHDLVTALYNASRRSPSKKLSDLFNGIAVTLTSGGNLSDFFSKRAETLLFDYRLERERNTKLSETFMDIYISVVIAAPLILMLLLMMMKISGFGISFSSSAITLITVSVVSFINLGFLLFLHLKQPSQ
jgi:archaeal flagellar protein FlaJ